MSRWHHLAIVLFAALGFMCAGCNQGGGGGEGGDEGEEASNWDSAQTRIDACVETLCSPDSSPHYACQFSGWTANTPPDECDGLWESFILSHAEDDCEMILNGFITSRQVCIEDHGAAE